MNKKSVISIILSLVLCLQLAFAAAAAMTGDVDNDGTLSASDARLALRASVNLENLSDEEFNAADVDSDGKITAADARSILRASVNLEKLPEPQVHPEYHEFRTISVTGKTKCSFPGCEAELPSFNDIVNPLKTSTDGVNYFTCIMEEVTHNDKAQLGGSLGGAMDDGTNVENTEVSYSPLVVDRLITNTNFPANRQKYVSGLTDKDIKSIKIEKVKAIDFVEKLPASFKDKKTTYDISAIKSYSFPEVYKITLVVPAETIDITKTSPKTSVYDKIYSADYNSMLEEMRQEITSSFAALEQEMAELKDLIRIKTAGSITSNLVVEYYVTADNYTPVAAKYAHTFDCSFDIKVTNAADIFWVTPMLTMLQNMDMTSNTYYFFNNNFGLK